ncbi:MAG: 3-oxoacyl-[acyl-carrier-protein] synthase 2, partial [Gemmatimonadetes bacterium]|nr:3-oxoacyl-[acyl-carrier-protein] synthase 2 [Gemmatimonadota bacterium]
MADRRRVAVTGIGAVTPIGIGRQELWNGLRREQSAVATLTRFDPSLWRSHNAAQVNDFDAADFMDAKRVKRLDRFGAFSVACARQAIDDAGIDLAGEDRERVGAMMGSALGGIRFAEDQLHVFLKEGVKSLDPSLALNVFAGAASCNIAIELGAQGPNSTNAMSCASGTIAVGDAFRAIRDGYADIMFAGASEAPLAELCYGAFSIIRAMSTRNDDPAIASRPFDKDRDGFVLGEGAAVLVLEELERAMARGAHI